MKALSSIPGQPVFNTMDFGTYIPEHERAQLAAKLKETKSIQDRKKILRDSLKLNAPIDWYKQLNEK